MVFPFQPGSLHADGAIGYDIAIEVGDNQIDIQRHAALDEIALTAQSYVKIGRMHQQAGGSRPCLAIDVEHCSFRQHAERPQRERFVEVHAQIVVAGGIRHSGVRCIFSLSIRGLVIPPPGRPAAEGEIRPIGRLIVAGGGSYIPGYLGVGERVTGVVFRFYCDHGVLA
ncbi:MAG: hypothetical protein V3T55_07970, partial [Anaerolineales bacterium]